MWQHGTDEFTQHAAESGADRLFDSDTAPKNVAARTDDGRRATTPPILLLGATHQLANTYCRIPTDAHATFAVSSCPSPAHGPSPESTSLCHQSNVTHEMTNVQRSEQVEVCWRVIEGSSTRILTCAIFISSDEG